jgi:hypothetical protein
LQQQSNRQEGQGITALAFLLLKSSPELQLVLDRAFAFSMPSEIRRRDFSSSLINAQRFVPGTS